MASSNTPMVTVLEHCRVPPLPNAVAQNSTPLTFYDLVWLNLKPFSHLLFYDFYGTRTDFTQNIIPNLKTSLSLALQHYFLLAGNLITPTTTYNNNTCSISTNPAIRYLEGDSVSLTVAEYDVVDFIRLTGNQSRDFDELSCLAPQLPPGIKENSTGCEVLQVSPVLAIQVTYFQNHGICVGFTISHAVADGTTMFNFIRAWGSIAKHQNAPLSMMLENSRLFDVPFHDRSVIKDTNDLAGLFVSQMGKMYSSQTPLAPVPAPAKKVRATFVLGQTEMEALKKLASTKLPRLPHLSSFTVACGYIWSCLAKTQNVIDSCEDGEEELLIVSVNCRARLNPPLPETYFGNCITMCFINANNSQLVGEGGEGFVRAVELIAESIYKKLNEDGILKGAEMWYEEFEQVKKKWKPKRFLGISGSPKFYFYDIDFGWGKPRKYEFVSETLSISGRKDAQGDMEFGLCLTENKMVVFSAIFGEGLPIKA